TDYTLYLPLPLQRCRKVWGEGKERERERERKQDKEKQKDHISQTSHENQTNLETKLRWRFRLLRDERFFPLSADSLIFLPLLSCQCMSRGISLTQYCASHA